MWRLCKFTREVRTVRPGQASLAGKLTTTANLTITNHRLQIVNPSDLPRKAIFISTNQQTTQLTN